MIYQLFTGRYIDLSKLVSVSEITTGQLMNQFELHFQLLEGPIVIAQTDSGVMVNPNGWANWKVINADLEKEREVIITKWNEFLIKTPTVNG